MWGAGEKSSFLIIRRKEKEFTSNTPSLKSQRKMFDEWFCFLRLPKAADDKVWKCILELDNLLFVKFWYLKWYCAFFIVIVLSRWPLQSQYNLHITLPTSRHYSSQTGLTQYTAQCKTQGCHTSSVLLHLQIITPNLSEFYQIAQELTNYPKCQTGISDCFMLTWSSTVYSTVYRDP